jgi:hypothetical protein
MQHIASLRPLRTLLPIALVAAAAGCFPEHDYEGDYEMTYDVLLAASDGTPLDALAGETPVQVRHGLNDEYLVHLGASFCLLAGRYEEAVTYSDTPFMSIPPQDCFFTRGNKVFPMTLTGSATYTDGEDRFTIVLAGSYADGTTRGSATVELTESW